MDKLYVHFIYNFSANKTLFTYNVWKKREINIPRFSKKLSSNHNIPQFLSYLVNEFDILVVSQNTATVWIRDKHVFMQNYVLC